MERQPVFLYDRDLLSVDSLFTTQAERDEARRETVRDIPLAEISDFPNHPFKVRMDQASINWKIWNGSAFIFEVIRMRWPILKRLGQFSMKSGMDS